MIKNHHALFAVATLFAAVFFTACHTHQTGNRETNTGNPTGKSGNGHTAMTGLMTEESTAYLADDTLPDYL